MRILLRPFIEIYLPSEYYILNVACCEHIKTITGRNHYICFYYRLLSQIFDLLIIDLWSMINT